jgi:hypothetical protein
MKNVILMLILSIFISCETSEKEQKAIVNESVEATQSIEYKIFGDDFSEDLSISSQEMKIKYDNLKVGDSIEVVFEANVNSVCKKKGCWMKLALNDSLESMVRFKDYGFFVPKNLDNNKMIVHGYAFVEETSIEDLKHYAEDEGKSQEEIEAITAPKRSLSFTANGVKMLASEYIEETETQEAKEEESIADEV